jgi:pyruvate carboxylase subunit B
MRYTVTIEGRTFDVDLRGPVPLLDGEPVEADLQQVAGTDLHHLRMNGQSFPLLLRAGEHRGVWEIHANGSRLIAEAVDERTRAIRDLTGRESQIRGPRPVRAPMPGLVIRLDVETGQSVKPGQGVVIVEAMKMQNELKAEAAGVVSRILVTPGQPVEKGTVLVEFESE